MAPVSPGRRLGVTALLFAVAVMSVGVASVTHSVIGVFVAWIPLLAVPWWLTRPVAGDDVLVRAGADSGADEPGEPADGGDPFDRGGASGDEEPTGHSGPPEHCAAGDEASR